MVSPRGQSILVRAVAAVVLLLTGMSAAQADTLSAANAGQSESIVLAGGCFWGMQAVFEQLKGVTSVVAGYAGGKKATAHYELVSTGLTGHAESVLITFDPHVISLQQIFDVFFLVAHDPTERNRQGPDVGSQYRSVVFYTSDAQRAAAEAYIAHLEHEHVYDKPVVTQVVPLPAFYPAEAYHQDYVAHHPDSPYVQYEDLPKLALLRQKFPQLLKT